MSSKGYCCRISIALGLLCQSLCSYTQTSVGGSDFALGQKYEASGEYVIAFAAYKRSSEAGNPEGALRIAKLYESGLIGASTDRPDAAYQQALPWYREAARNGSREAKSFLLKWPDDADYRQGQVYEKAGDFPLAFIVYKRASDAGNPQAALQIAHLYESGKLGTAAHRPDIATHEALPWYQVAAKNGSGEAQDRLHSIYNRDGSSVQQRTPTAIDGLAGCPWPKDFSFIRDADMLTSLRNQDYKQKLDQGGLPIDVQIAIGESALSQIAGTLPDIEATIRGISQPTISHYNFQFDYERTCKQNNQKNGLLAAECQHVNVENTRYALNGTLQIMDCLAGRPIRADIGPNRDISMPQDELPGAPNSSLVSPSTAQSDFHCPKEGEAFHGDILPKQCQTPSQKPGPPTGRRTQ